MEFSHLYHGLLKPSAPHDSLNVVCGFAGRRAKTYVPALSSTIVSVGKIPIS